MIQVGGIIIIYCLGLFNLVSLALCCGMSEIMLLYYSYSKRLLYIIRNGIMKSVMRDETISDNRGRV